MSRTSPLLVALACLLLAATLTVSDADAAGRLNVNSASAAELAKVPGLDAQIAVRIVARRSARPFKTLDELLEVQGITKLTMISAAEFLDAGPALAPATPTPAAAPAPPPSGKKLDLNKATFSELLLLPEITPRTAKAIVDFREQNHGFKSVDDLAKVPGLDKRSMITLFDRVTVKTASSTDPDVITLGEEPWNGNWTAKLDGTPAPAVTPTLKPLSPGEKIDINTASREDLERLPDIGPVMAQRILDYRKSQGAFDTIDELLDVRGIGANRLTSLRPWVTIAGGSRVAEPRSTPRATPTKVAVVAKTPRPAATEVEAPATPVPTPTKVAMATAPKPAITPDGRVNINVASIDELLTLPRMTKEIAQEIVDYRSKNGPFRDPHAIVDVPSIGEAAYARMRDKLAAE